MGSAVVLDLLVENLGRVNFGSSVVYADQRKGLVGGDILLDGEALKDWEARPLMFKSQWVKQYVKKHWLSAPKSKQKFDIIIFLLLEG